MKFLCEFRKKKGFTQEELAKIIGVKKNSIARYERGEVSPSIERANQIAKILNVSLDELVNGPLRKSKRRKKAALIIKADAKKTFLSRFIEGDNYE